MRLDLRFSNRSLEDIWCEAVVALVFKRPYLTGGGLAGLNEKMGGFLARLEKRGFWTGHDGETILLAAQDMIKAEKILLKGLGQSSAYSTQCLRERMGELSTTLDRIKVKDFGIHLPILEGTEGEYPLHLELSVCHLVEPYLEKHQHEREFLLKIVFSLEKYFEGDLNSMVDRVREHFSSRLDLSIVVERRGQGEQNLER